jgi:LysR family glycine cleavage system transcriptional activator
MSDALQRLPNLAALRAFEAAARHENFSRAAEEVHLTHGAISHQIRALEEELGLQLFQRHGKRIAITAEGQRFAAVVRKSLGDIAAAAAELKDSTRARRLVITAVPSLSARWLAGRMGKFIDLHPDIEVTMQTTVDMVDLTRGQVDVAVRFGSGNYPGVKAEMLIGDFFYPVVSPHYRGGKLPRTPQELTPDMLLRSDSGEPWSMWFHAAGIDLPEPGGGVMFDDSSMLLRSAAAGHGVAIARHLIAMPEIADGALVRLFDVAVRCRYSYYIAYTERAFEKSQVRAFRDWLVAEAQEFKQQTEWPETGDELA